MEQKLSALVVDDEESARKLLVKLLEETQYFSDLRVAQSVASATKELNFFEPDIIFLDIRMPGKDGFAFIHDLKLRNQKPEIVFVTAYDQYAIRAIKSHAFDYLLKPVSRKELKQCCNRFRERKFIINPSNSTSNAETAERLTRLRINTRTGTIFINPDTILYCKAEGNYTTICTGDKQYLCSMNLGKVSELLPGNGFIRIGRSFILNFEYVTLLDRKESSVTMVRDSESATIKIPRQHLKDLNLI